MSIADCLTGEQERKLLKDILTYKTIFIKNGAGYFLIVT